MLKWQQSWTKYFKYQEFEVRSFKNYCKYQIFEILFSTLSTQVLSFILFYLFLFFFIRGSTCTDYCRLHIPTTVLALSFALFPPEVPPWECDRSHSLLCCIVFARGHRETAENLCRHGRPFNRVYPQSIVSEKNDLLLSVSSKILISSRY